MSPTRFKKIVAPVYLRRNQNDVLRELPERIDMESWVDLSQHDLAAYQDAVFNRDFAQMRRIAILGSSGRPSSKFDTLKTLLAEHREEGRKVLIFSFFLDVLRALENHFDIHGSIQGSVPPARRMEIIDRFHHAQGHRILIAQVSVAGVGLNLHAASAVVIMEPQWKPSTEEQAIARAHRMGQTRSVLVHRLLTRNSVEERMVELLGRKARLFEAYARESAVKEQSKEATEAQLTNRVIDMEIERLTAA